MFERFTERARKVMALANQEAQRFGHGYIGTEHILLGLIKDGSGIGGNVLTGLKIDLANVRAEIEKLVRPGPGGQSVGKLPGTPKAKKVVEYAIEEARQLGHRHVGTEHLLLGLMRETDGVAAQVLMHMGVGIDAIRAGLAAAATSGGWEVADPACPTPPSASAPATGIEDPRLRIVVECWPKLPRVLQEGIVAMVRDAANQ